MGAFSGHCDASRRFVDSSIFLELEPDQDQEVDGDHGDVVGDEDGEVGPGPGEVLVDGGQVVGAEEDGVQACVVLGLELETSLFILC